jgi:ABC-type Zn uptake system ZnuABC Zn-binding protein ZnuA
MRSWLIAVATAAAFAAGVSGPASAGLRIVASTGDLAALATAITADPGVESAGVSVDTIVPPGLDAEAFEPRPADIEKLRHADIVVRVGLGYDYWLDRLLAHSGNARVMRGGDGYVDGSIGVPLLEVREVSVASESGHSHGAANPHYWLDPQNAVIVTGGIAEALIRILPSARERIVAGRERFLAALAARMAAWRMQAAAFAGVRLIAYHDAWPYFARRFRLDLVDFIEPKPGIAPSPAHLAQLVATGRQAGVRAVLHEPYEPAETSRFVAARLGVPLVVLAPSVGSLPGTGDYLSLFDANLAALGKALGETHP